MNEIVLDASALLALLNNEKGADLVQEALPEAVISTVNLAEVVTRLSIAGMPEKEIQETLALLALEMIPFNSEHAFRAGLINPQKRPRSLSLGDRACLALAMERNAVAMTSDRTWKDAGVNIPIKFIR